MREKVIEKQLAEEVKRQGVVGYARSGTLAHRVGQTESFYYLMGNSGS